MQKVQFPKCDCKHQLSSYFASRYTMYSGAHQILWTREHITLYIIPILRAKFKHGIQCHYVYNWLHHSFAQQDTLNGLLSIILCESSTASILDQVKGKLLEQSNGVMLLVNRLQLFLLCAINFISIASLQT